MRLLYIFLMLFFGGVPGSLFGQDIEQVAQEKPFEWSGSIGGNSTFYGVSGIPERSNPFIWNVSANLTGKFYGFTLPFSFTLGKHNSSFSRPFLQAGISPSYKWVKLHLGKRSMNFSKYTLAGHLFDGAGIELTPGNFYFSAMYGRFRKARDFDENLEDRFYKAVFKRTGYAVKIGVQNEESHFSLSYLQAEDDPNSLSVLPADTLITPSKNSVLGVKMGIVIAKSATLFAEGAASLYTRNIHSIEVEDKFNPVITSLFNPTFSTRFNYAFETGLKLDFKSINLKLGYERIMPNFETMGAYFFANDRENITIGPRFRLLKNRMQITGKLGFPFRARVADANGPPVFA